MCYVVTPIKDASTSTLGSALALRFPLPRVGYFPIPSLSDSTMDDIDAFFAEQEQHMNIPNEDVDEYIRARLEDFHRNRDHVIDHVIHAQGHPRKVDTSWHSSGPFLPSAIEAATSELQKSDEEVPRQLKRKSTEPEPPAQAKKPRLRNVTTSGPVLPAVFSRSDNAERTPKYVDPYIHFQLV
ncbi:uncharacterized protein EDB91DRAFT_665529 [Suillus paluster]|uniref:uncharacterized protein n=1 Tax=Suillus paluster TaxID=48578 RepID=UPI001B882462|nr:uncharacterized protein EDB91DRAFT_665529 [Suillus paluster]KAG1732643.1 hypothetical protein EDB91DRAFT_665529 [Suillus paluster]